MGTREKPHHRSSQAELQKQTTEIQKYLLNGYTRAYILEVTKPWGLSDRQIDERIKLATEAIREINLIERDDNLATITSNLWELFRSAKHSGEIESARKILMDIGKLRGLDEQTINHIVSERPLQDVDTEDLKASLPRASNGRH